MRNSTSNWLDNAKVWGQHSPCTRRKVGAIIVARPWDADFLVLGKGFNVGPEDEPSCEQGGCPRGRLSYEECAAYSDYRSGPGRCHATHAEVRAIEDFTKDMDGVTIDASVPGWGFRLPYRPIMFVSEVPCKYCWKAIDHAGIGAIFPKGPRR